MAENSLLKSFLVGSVGALLIIGLYNLYCNYQTDRKVEKISSFLDINSTCEDILN